VARRGGGQARIVVGMRLPFSLLIQGELFKGIDGGDGAHAVTKHRARRAQALQR
jgi:hypothetical protein